MTYSLITGASKGIGCEMALECARQGRNLVLIALPNEQLTTLASEIAQEYEVDVKFREVDLTAPAAIGELYEWCRQNGLEVDMLINNAGLGSQGSFSAENINYYRKLMQINMEAMVLVTAQFLPMLKRQKRSYVLNMGSIASFMHIPFKQVYAASKNFVLAYSNALHYELKPDNISVTCLCPGPTITNDKVAARVKEQGWKSRLVTLSAAAVAHKGIRGLLKGKRTVIPGLGNRVLVKLFQVIPTSWGLRLSGNMFNKSGEVLSSQEEELADTKAI